MKKRNIGLMVAGMIIVIVGILLVASNKPKRECFVTSITNQHTHVWCKGDAYTQESCNGGVCHKHKIDEKDNLAEIAGTNPHTHKLREIAG